MTFEGVVRRPVYEQVADQLREAILDGTLQAGEVLPAERELCERFGVSRTSVREALRALQAQGLVVVAGANAPLRVAGAESFSNDTVRASLTHLLRLGRVPLADLVELRVALEAAVAEAAARRRPRPDLGPRAGAARRAVRGAVSTSRRSRRPTCASTWRSRSRPATARSSS